MEVVVKVHHLAAGELEIIRDLEQGEILLGDQAVSEQVLAEIFLEGAPEISAGGVDHDQRDDVGLAGLHEGEGLERFVHGAEASREEGDGIGVLHEVQLTGEEVFESEKLGVPADGFVGFLLEGQLDVQGKAVFAPGTGLGGAHNAIPAAGDDHVARLLHQFSKKVGGFPGGGVGRGPGRAEDGDFFDALVGGEEAVCVTDFPHHPLELLEVAEVGPIRSHPQSDSNHLLEDLPILGDASCGDQLFNVGVQRVR